MLLNFKFSLKKGLAIMATTASIFASLAVGANNTVQFLQRIESSPSSESFRLLESGTKNFQQPYPFEDF